MHRQRGQREHRPGRRAGGDRPGLDPLRRASDFELIPVGDTRRAGRAHVRDAVAVHGRSGSREDKGFHFACRALDGDGVLVARVVSVGGAAARAGILMRSGPQPTPRHQGRLAAARRGRRTAGAGAPRPGREPRSSPTTARRSPPGSSKLARHGNGIQGWGSANGRDWDLIASIRFHELPGTMLWAWPPCSGSADTTTTAAFDHVRLVSAPRARRRTAIPGSPSPASAAASASPGGGSLGTTYHNVLRAAVHGGPYVRIAHGIDGLAYEDTTALEGVPYHYVIDAVGHGRPNLRSNEASARWLAGTGE